MPRSSFQKESGDAKAGIIRRIGHHHVDGPGPQWGPRAMFDDDIVQAVAARPQGGAFHGPGMRVDGDNASPPRPEGGCQRHRAAAAAHVQNAVSGRNLHGRHELPCPGIHFAMGEDARPADGVNQAVAVAKDELAAEIPHAVSAAGPAGRDRPCPAATRGG